MPRVTNTIEIKATPDRVWEVLGDLAATRNWLPGVVAARLDGMARICTMADGQEVREEISDYSTEARSFRFRHVRVPLPVRSSEGAFSVTPGAAGAIVTLDTSFEPLDPTAGDEVARMIDGAFGQSLESLRRFVEHGKAWDAS